MKTLMKILCAASLILTLSGCSKNKKNIELASTSRKGLEKELMRNEQKTLSPMEKQLRAKYSRLEFLCRYSMNSKNDKSDKTVVLWNVLKDFSVEKAVSFESSVKNMKAKVALQLILDVVNGTTLRLTSADGKKEFQLQDYPMLVAESDIELTEYDREGRIVSESTDYRKTHDFYDRVPQMIFKFSSQASDGSVVKAMNIGCLLDGDVKKGYEKDFSFKKLD